MSSQVIVGTFRDLTVLASILMLTLVAYSTTPPSPHFLSVEELQLRFPWVKQSFNLILIWSFVYGGAGVAVQFLYLIVVSCKLFRLVRFSQTCSEFRVPFSTTPTEESLGETLLLCVS